MICMIIMFVVNVADLFITKVFWGINLCHIYA